MEDEDDEDDFVSIYDRTPLATDAPFFNILLDHCIDNFMLYQIRIFIEASPSYARPVSAKPIWNKVVAKLHIIDNEEKFWIGVDLGNESLEHFVMILPQLLQFMKQKKLEQNSVPSEWLYPTNDFIKVWGVIDYALDSFRNQMKPFKEELLSLWNNGHNLNLRRDYANPGKLHNL
jgi:hypothetical protein